MANYRLTRRNLLRSAAATAVAAALPLSSGAKSRPPNVIFVLADDLGYGDLSAYGRREYATPNLDRLANRGVKLTQAYSNSAVCTPTRVAYTTGRYQQRLPIGLEEPLRSQKEVGTRVGLPPSLPTVASLLRANSYHTALIGKWHMGYLPAYGPLKSGYEEFFGIMSGAGDYFTHRDTDGVADLFEAEVPVERVGYLTDLITQRAIEYVGARGRDRAPFYLSLFYNAPHWPWEGPHDEAVSRDLKSLWHLDGGSLDTYAEMVTAMDAGIGKVLAALVAAGLDSNTLVLFSSDNGGERFSYEWPFWGQKGDLWEGGLRVPAILRWPGVLPEGGVSSQVAITMDWTATILAATGTRPDEAFPLDGENLLPVLMGRAPEHDRQLFWRMAGKNPQRAVRSGNLKYLKVGGTEYLFELQKDPRERANLAAKRPAEFEKLRGEFDSWNQTMLPDVANVQITAN